MYSPTFNTMVFSNPVEGIRRLVTGTLILRPSSRVLSTNKVIGVGNFWGGIGVTNSNKKFYGGEYFFL